MNDLESKLKESKELIPEPSINLDIKLEERLSAEEKVRKPHKLKFAFAMTAIFAVTLSALALALFIPSASMKNTSLVHNLPESKVMMSVSDDLVTRTASKSLSKLTPYLTKENVEDTVLSPATYTLAVAGLSAVSDNFNNEAFGLNDAGSDVKALLEAWNFKVKSKESYTYFRAAVLHQQIGETYAFGKNKQEEISEKYISTLVSSRDSYRKDADKFFKRKIGLNLKVPDLNLAGDGVATYGVLKMKDYVPNGLTHQKMPFTFNTGEGIADSYIFARENNPALVPYYAGPNYEVFTVHVRKTKLLIVLPNINTNINEVNVSEAYDLFIRENTKVAAFGYVPFFHNKVEGLNLINTLQNVITGDEVYMSKLLKEEVKNDLMITSVIQSTDFEFNKYGVSGESMTVIPGAGAPAPLEVPPLDLSVNRPFYAFSLKDNFPLFVNKVSSPGK